MQLGQCLEGGPSPPDLLISQTHGPGQAVGRLAAQGMADTQQALRDVCKRPMALEHLEANSELRGTIWSSSLERE